MYGPDMYTCMEVTCLFTHGSAEVIGIHRRQVWGHDAGARGYRGRTSRQLVGRSVGRSVSQSVIQSVSLSVSQTLSRSVGQAESVQFNSVSLVIQSVSRSDSHSMEC